MKGLLHFLRFFKSSQIRFHFSCLTILPKKLFLNILAGLLFWISGFSVYAQHPTSQILKSEVVPYSNSEKDEALLMSKEEKIKDSIDRYEAFLKSAGKGSVQEIIGSLKSDLKESDFKFIEEKSKEHLAKTLKLKRINDTEFMLSLENENLKIKIVDPDSGIIFADGKKFHIDPSKPAKELWKEFEGPIVNPVSLINPFSSGFANSTAALNLFFTHQRAHGIFGFLLGLFAIGYIAKALIVNCPELRRTLDECKRNPASAEARRGIRRVKSYWTQVWKLGCPFSASDFDCTCLKKCRNAPAPQGDQ